MSTGVSPIRILVVGRFQPPHLGHMHLLKQAAELGEVIVVVGSAEKSRVTNNPFSCRERLEMLKQALVEGGFDLSKFTLTPIEDTHSNELWVARVEMLTPKFDVVMTGNSQVGDLFRAKGYRVVNPHQLKPRVYNGSAIRRASGRKKVWEKSVPKSVVNFIHTHKLLKVFQTG